MKVFSRSAISLLNIRKTVCYKGRVSVRQPNTSFVKLEITLTRRYLALCLFAAWSIAMLPTHAIGQIDFNRDVRPILSNKCYKCHGPDEDQRQAGLRLDTREGRFAETESGAVAVVPGRPDDSQLIFRVENNDPDVRMPPAGEGEALETADIELLRDWIASGAQSEKHWSYLAPVHAAVPDVGDSIWPKNDIDHFILRRLQQEQLNPSSEADRNTLIRRVSLDLTGLPPTPEAVRQFVADSDEQAYENLVDQLLSHSSYGEHWTRMWLDLARYADSAGYADDLARTIWGFRDWVIRALNRNMPFNQFTIEQIAGDLLPDPTVDQLIATAFHRNTQTNNEGGTDDEEYRNVAIVDRVNTTMAVWMGTTMACAQCHNHKYDPISQSEYFQMFAIFNNTKDADKRDESPFIEIWTDQQEEEKAAHREQIQQLEQQLRTNTPELLDAKAGWEQRLASFRGWSTATPTTVTAQSGNTANIDEEGVIHFSESDKTDIYNLRFTAPEARSLTVLRIETLPHKDLPKQGAGHGDGDFVVTRVLATVLPSPTSDKTLHERDQQEDAPHLEFAAAYSDFSQEGFEADNVLKEKDPNDSGWAVTDQVTQPHNLSLVLRDPLLIPAGATLSVKIEQLSEHAQHTLGNFRISLAGDTPVEDFVSVSPSILAIARMPVDSRSDVQQQELAKFYSSIAPLLADVRKQLSSVKKKLADAKPYTIVPVMRELEADKSRETRIQQRGNFLDTTDKVQAGLPSVFHDTPTDKKQVDRLTLAEWLVHEKNPLTARVIANRYWESIFGQGIVLTSEEFGSQGELPSHPQLLDWLASELVRQNWDIKAFLKLLVTSAAYRQSSRVTDEALNRDPDNRLLARGPRFRLSAEMIRDQALFVSGLLSEKMYGPPAKPPQPELGIKAAFGSTIDWQASDGEDRYRRALYTTWRRSNPYPSMATFDAPNREVCTVRRDRTNTPLQALVTLNDPVYVEAAQSLARRIVTYGDPNLSVAERVRYGFRLCLSRPPNEAESETLINLFEASRLDLAANVDRATSLASEPLGPVPEGADVFDLAAWTVVGNVLLNLDEMFLKR